MQGIAETVIGVVSVLAGLLLFRYRAPIAKANAAAQRAAWGKLGDFIARRGAAPVWMGAVGVVFVVNGVSTILFGILALTGVLPPPKA